LVAAWAAVGLAADTISTPAYKTSAVSVVRTKTASEFFR
jgi:hypothetical protein